MLLKIAFVLLCLAQILHFSRHWLSLTRTMRASRDQEAMAVHLDWTRPAASRRAPKKRGPLASFWHG